MHKIIFISLISLILLITGCFTDADTLKKSAADGFKDFEYISGKFCSDGFIQLNSRKLISDFNVKIYEHSETYTKSLSPTLEIFKNKLSRQYSYFISFGRVSDRSNKISIEILRNGDLLNDFSFEIEQYPKLPVIENVRELGESGVFKIENDSILGSNISTNPNIWVKFSHSVQPTELKVHLKSLSDKSIIPCTIEYSENPYILINAAYKLQYNQVYRLIFAIDNVEIESSIQFITKKLHGVFNTFDINSNQKQLITSDYIINIAKNLDVLKIVKFNDFIIADTYGTYIFPETYNFVVLSADGSLKLIDDYKLKLITGKFELDAISGMISADFDNNGLDEILVYNNFGESIVYRINNDYELEYYNEYNFALHDDMLTSLYISDIDNNGWYDFIAGYASGLVNVIYRSDIFIDFTMIPVTRLDAPIDHIELADFNRDSILDLVISDKAGGLSVYLRIANTWQSQVLSENFHVNSFIIQDLNHDGYKDIIVNTDEVYLVYFKNLIYSFEPNNIDYPDNQIVGDFLFSKGFENHVSSNLLIYFPLINSIRTFSLTSEDKSINVLKTVNISNNLYIKKSSFKTDANINKIISVELNNDRLDDLIVISNDNLTIYYQMRDVNSESFSYKRKFRLSGEYSQKPMITDLNNDSFKDILLLNKNLIVVVSTYDLSDFTLNLPLSQDETLVDFVHFYQDNADYLAIMTSQRLLIGTIQADSESGNYIFDIIHTELASADSIYVLDFNDDRLNDIIITNKTSSMLYLSELSDDKTTLQFRISIELPFANLLNSVDGEFDSFLKVEKTKLQLSKYTEWGLESTNFDLTTHNAKNPEIVVFKNDIDRDGDDDIFLLRTSSGITTVDVLMSNSNKSYKILVDLSSKLTSIVKSNNLRYVGLLDLDSDSWTDLVFSDRNNDLYVLKIRDP